MKFRKRVRVFPGLTLNLSKSGISTTVGPRGMNVNFNRHGTFLNTGLPGTGIYDRHRIGGGKGKRRINDKERRLITQYVQDLPPDTTPPLKAATCPGLNELYQTLQECHQERERLKRELVLAQKQALRWKRLHTLSLILLVGFALKWFREKRNESMAYALATEEQLDNCTVNVDVNCDGSTAAAYTDLLQAYAALLRSEKAWDHSVRSNTNTRIDRSTASHNINRIAVQHRYANLPLISSSFDGMHLENATGADIFLYPAFVALVAGPGQFALLDMAQLHIRFHTIHFKEEGPVPSDAHTMGSEWLKANKDGSRDRRFRENYQVPMVEYAELHITHPSGLDERCAFSHVDAARSFAEAYKAFKLTLA